MYFLGWSYLEHGWMCSRSSSTIAVAVYSIVICIYDGVYFVEKEWILYVASSDTAKAEGISFSWTAVGSKQDRRLSVANTN